MVAQLKEIQQLEDVIKSSVNTQDRQRIFTAVDSSFQNIFNKQRATRPVIEISSF
jgi:hypothetical protein